MAINFCCSQQILSPFLFTYNEACRHERIKENGRRFYSDQFGVLEWLNVTVNNLAGVELRMWRKFYWHCLLASQALPHGLERQIVLGRRANARSHHETLNWSSPVLPCPWFLYYDLLFIFSQLHIFFYPPPYLASFPEVLIVSRSSPSDWTHLFLLFLLLPDMVTKKE